MRSHTGSCVCVCVLLNIGYRLRVIDLEDNIHRRTKSPAEGNLEAPIETRRTTCLAVKC